jgi:hypothetical protein
MLIDVAIPGSKNVIKKEDETISIYIDLIIKNSAHVECDSKSDTGNNRGDCNHIYKKK